MIGWIIFGSILLILIIVLAQSITVTAVYDGNPEITIKILCFTIIKIPADPKALEKKKRKQKKKEERERKKQAAKAKKAAAKANKTAAKQSNITGTGSVETPETADSGTTENTEAQENSSDTEKADSSKPKKAKKEKKPKKKLDLDFQMIMDYVRSASPPIKRLFKKIRIRDVYIDWVVGSDEAGKTALKYGGLCTAIYSLQKFLTTYFDTKIGEINIEADFQAEKDDIFIYFVLKLRISTILACTIWLGVRVLKTYLKYNKKPKAVKHHGTMKPAASR